jgi:hypothetical protein
LLQASLPVRLNMIEPNNGQALSPKDSRLLAPKGSQARYTGELLLRTRPKTYRAIVRELAEPNASVNGIARRYRVSNHTVMGIREREAKSIAAVGSRSRELRSGRFHFREIELCFPGDDIDGHRLLLEIEAIEHVIRLLIAGCERS